MVHFSRQSNVHESEEIQLEEGPSSPVRLLSGFQRENTHNVQVLKIKTLDAPPPIPNTQKVAVMSPTADISSAPIPAGTRANRMPLFAKPSRNPNLTQSVDDQTKVYMSKNVFLNTDTLCDVISGILLVRTAYVILGEMAILTTATLSKFIVIFIPFNVLVMQVVNFHDQYIAKSDLIHYIYTGFRLALLLGLGWNAPSAFSSALDNMAGYTFFIAIAKGTIATTHAFMAIWDPPSQKMLTLLSATLLFLPIIPWVLSLIFIDKQSFTAFSIAVGLDVVCGLSVDAIQISTDLRRFFAFSKFVEESDTSLAEPKHMAWLQESRTRVVIQTASILAAGVPYLIEQRPDAIFLDAIMTIPFNILNYIYGTFSLIILYLVFIVYKNVFAWRIHSLPVLGSSDSDEANDRENPHSKRARQIKNFRSAILHHKSTEWIHLPLRGAIVILIASLALQVPLWYKATQGFDGFYAAFPMNVTLFNNGGVLDTINDTGVSYLTRAIQFQGTPLQKFVASDWAPRDLFLYSSAAIFGTLTLLAFVSGLDVIREESQMASDSSSSWKQISQRLGWISLVRLGFGLIFIALNAFSYSTDTRIVFLVGLIVHFMAGCLEEIWRIQSRKVG